MLVRKAWQESGIAKQTPDQRAMIDAVLFALWAQGHRERSVAASVLMIPASWILGGLVGLFFLPGTLLRRLPEIMLAGIFAGLTVYVVEDAWLFNGGVVFALALLMLLKEPILLFLRTLLYDIGDLLTLGALTRRYIDRHLMFGPLIKNDDDTYWLREHLFVSRTLTSGPYQAEATAFQDIISRQVVGDWSELESHIQEYWRKFPVEPSYWQGLLNRQHWK
ncbi:hypothetical protein V3589_32340 [Sinorhizobium fredii]|uniref:hypothetical protein n=1 Tax=Rhizobium fredii TaxID=380 RepID=UPI0030AA6A46